VVTVALMLYAAVAVFALVLGIDWLLWWVRR